MIKKRRKIPLRLRMEEALLHRLPPNHEKWAEIRRNFKKGQAGYKGEIELDFHLGYLDDDNFHIFQDLRIPIEEEHIFQMDTLILTPQFALIIESKNIYGTLYFEPNSKQVIRTFDGIREGFADPLQQVKRQEKMFKRWMAKHMLKPCPTYSLVAIGYPSTIVQTSPDNHHIFHRLLHAEHILDKIDELVDASPTQYLTTYQIKKITQLLLDQHTPPSFDALTHYSIKPNELILGVPCPHCSMQTMQRIFGKWLCPQCDRPLQMHTSLLFAIICFFAVPYLMPKSDKYSKLTPLTP
jgi:hypothetical protein